MASLICVAGAARDVMGTHVTIPSLDALAENDNPTVSMARSLARFLLAGLTTPLVDFAATRKLERKKRIPF